MPEKHASTIENRYAGLTEQYPGLESHIHALQNLRSKKPYKGLSDSSLEAILMFSLWTENPVEAIEIARRVNISEQLLNRYIDRVIYKLGNAANKMYDLRTELGSE